MPVSGHSACRRYRTIVADPPWPVVGDSDAMNPHNQLGRDRITAEFGNGDQEKPWREAMGVEWMGRYEAREAIPPAYTEHIGHYLVRAVADARQEAAA